MACGEPEGAGSTPTETKRQGWGGGLFFSGGEGGGGGEGGFG